MTRWQRFVRWLKHKHCQHMITVKKTEQHGRFAPSRVVNDFIWTCCECGEISEGLFFKRVVRKAWETVDRQQE